MRWRKVGGESETERGQPRGERVSRVLYGHPHERGLHVGVGIEEASRQSRELILVSDGPAAREIGVSLCTLYNRVKNRHSHREVIAVRLEKTPTVNCVRLLYSRVSVCREVKLPNAVEGMGHSG